MRLQPFRKIASASDDLNQVQDNVKAAVDELRRNPILDWNLIRGEALKAGTNLVGHGLGRPFISCFIGIPSTAVTLSRGTSPDTSKYIAIVASGPCTVDLYFF